jgi:hypothetical protein
VSLRVHCEACGDDYPADTTMAALALPVEPSTINWIAGVFGRNTSPCHQMHHLCPRCGQALLAFIRGVGRSLREGVTS